MKTKEELQIEAAAKRADIKGRTIYSKYDGYCKTCNKPYSEGDEVIWLGPSKGCVHPTEECAPDIEAEIDPASGLAEGVRTVSEDDRLRNTPKASRGEFDIPVLFRIKAPSLEAAQGELDYFLKQYTSRHIASIQFLYMGKKKK